MKAIVNAYSGAERLNSIADVLVDLLADERPAYELCGLARNHALAALRAIGAAEALQAAMDEAQLPEADEPADDLAPLAHKPCANCKHSWLRHGSGEEDGGRPERCTAGPGPDSGGYAVPCTCSRYIDPDYVAGEVDALVKLGLAHDAQVKRGPVGGA